MSLSVDLPPEPDDRSVVLDREADAWQRRTSDAHGRHRDRWVSLSGLRSSSWRHLLVDRGPLALLVTETERAESYGVQPGGDVLLAAGDAAWLNVLVDNAALLSDQDGPMDWEGAGRERAKTLLGYGAVPA